MTSHSLYEILQLIDAVDTQLDLQTTLTHIKDALDSLVTQPAQPQYQTALATGLNTFETSAAKLSDLITPSQFTAISEMGGAEFFDPAIAKRVKAAIQSNAMTPSVARDFVQELAIKRDKFLKIARDARQNLEKLGIKGVSLQPGSADLAFLIPRDIFNNHLSAFAKELTFISRLIGHISEGITGHTEEVELEQLSSSVPTIALAASTHVINVFATIVNKFLDAWKKIEEIRQMRTKLGSMVRSTVALNELTDEITTTVDEVVEEATTLVLVKYNGSAERKNELSNALRQETHRLFGQIERGLLVEFRAVPTNEEETEEGKALANIADISRVIQFPQIPQDPMLLSTGEILEGDIGSVKHTKTTTRKTTTSKKSVPSE